MKKPKIVKTSTDPRILGLLKIYIRGDGDLKFAIRIHGHFHPLVSTYVDTIPS